MVLSIGKIAFLKKFGVLSIPYGQTIQAKGGYFANVYNGAVC